MSWPPSRARRVLRWSRRLVAVVVSVCALVGAVRLIAPATSGTTGEPPGVRRQLTFLRAALDGLSWVELGMREA
ncbi:hypothetical protein [Actinomadura sp. HBU206391]|uniref:hypothetical protein n=1 Tax=Actinomadura sp. HBU206391 TaxID=2731692 RepID=UPI00164F0174|nr:hypothetical protein [Actinomadura sp. HBU206391]MBC6459927.1 hypothetical protein [Actinomadura sp. HBU206391]